MTMTPAETERKVRQLDNDVQSIYELLGDLQAKVNTIAATQLRHGNRLDEMDRRFDGIDGRLDAIDAKLDEILTLVRER